MSYRCIVADPPWEEYGGGRRGAQNHYPLLSPLEIVDVMLTCPKWKPADDCLLWLWTTDNWLRHALGVIDALGFRYIRTCVWVKRNALGNLQIGLGQYMRGSHEICLLAGVGKTRDLVVEKLPSVFEGPRVKHSRKPESFFARVEQSTIGPRLEMFARETRPGWDSFGNEVKDGA